MLKQKKNKFYIVLFEVNMHIINDYLNTND